MTTTQTAYWMVDALRVEHKLAKKGIPIYNVYCGYSNGGLTETFYHALSHITQGQCVSLENADTLSKIVQVPPWSDKQ